MKKQWIAAGFAIGLASLLGLCGCEVGTGSHDDDGIDHPGILNSQVSGVWAGTRSSSAGSAAVTLTLTQVGGVLGGSYSDTSLFAGSVSGSINGEAIDIVVTMASTPVPHPAGETWTLKGAVNSATNKIVATMTDQHSGLTFALNVTK